MELSEEVKKIVLERIDIYGTNPKTGTNTLKGSRLEQSLDVYPIENGIALEIYDYWQFVARGWERTGTMSRFIKNIDSWVKRKNIHLGDLTQSQMVFVITNNILRNGLRERPFMIYNNEGDLEKMIPELSGIIDKWFDKLFNEIMTDVDKFFNS